MRLLIISDAWEPQINGVVRVYQHITRELRAMGHTVGVIGPDQFLSVPMPGYNEIKLSLFPARKLAKLIEKFAPDSIHIAVEGPMGYAARAYCIKHNKPFTTFFHSQFPDYVAARVAWMGTYLTNAIRNFAIASARNFHAPARATYVATQSLADQLRGWGMEQPFVRIAFGVDFTLFHTGPRNLFTDLPRPIHLYVGRVAVEKNIEAFLALPLEGSKIIVGQGPQLDELKRAYPEAIFTGAKQGPVLGDHFRSADVFVFPSKTDTFGLVLIEAMACGLPIAAYNVTGPKDIVTDESLGGVADSLYDAVLLAYASKGTADARFAHAKKLYSWPAIAKAFLETETMAQQ